MLFDISLGSDGMQGSAVLYKEVSRYTQPLLNMQRKDTPCLKLAYLQVATSIVHYTLA